MAMTMGHVKGPAIHGVKRCQVLILAIFLATAADLCLSQRTRSPPPRQAQTWTGIIVPLGEQLWLAADPDGSFQLNFNGNPSTSATAGARVRVAGTLDLSNLTIYVQQLTSEADSATIDGTAVGSSTSTAQEGNITSITYIVDVCGYRSRITTEQLRSQLSGGSTDRASAGVALSDYWPQCSYGHLQYYPSQNAVVGPIDINTPAVCSAVANSCSDLANVLPAAVSQRATAAGIKTGLYSQQVFILPGTLPCSMGGLGFIGCRRNSGAGDCSSFVKLGAVPDTSQPERLTLGTVIHEMAHNFGLEHANKDGVEYQDISCPMGSSFNTVCFNPVHNEMLGWAKPLAAVDEGDMAAGTWYRYPLPATAYEDRNYIRVAATAAPALSRPLYIAFRAAVGMDAKLPTAAANRVFVYSTSSMGAGASDALANLTSSQQWPLNPTVGQVAVRVEKLVAASSSSSSTSNVGASVLLCRVGRTGQCREGGMARVIALPGGTGSAGTD